MTDEMSVAEAAEALATSPQTVRALLRSGELTGRRVSRGTRHVWIASRKGVDAFLSQYGRLDGRRRPRSRLAQLEQTVAELQRQLLSLGQPSTETAGRSSHAVEAERDDLRSQVVALKEALAHTRHAAELQRRADEERAALVEHLLAATAAAEKTDALRREALASLDEAIAGLTRPGHLTQA